MSFEAYSLQHTKNNEWELMEIYCRTVEYEKIIPTTSKMWNHIQTLKSTNIEAMNLCSTQSKRLIYKKMINTLVLWVSKHSCL
jgi:lysyl-tRNA synthetase class II